MTAHFWLSGKSWLGSAHNTAWCLLGCSIGDLGTIGFFQVMEIGWPTLAIMTLAIINGLITSIILETVVLSLRGLTFKQALHTALGMSFLSMIAMETAMNATDWVYTGGARLNWAVLPLILSAGFIVPWPYNYWRLEKFGKACH